MLFVSNRLSNLVLTKPVPRHQVRDPDVLYLLFGCVAEQKLPVHYHLLNLFATVSPIEELRIVFTVAPITGIQGAEPPKERLAQSLTESFERIRETDPVPAGAEARRLDIGGRQWRSIADRSSAPPKLSVFRCRPCTVAPAAGGASAQVHAIGVVDIDGGGATPASIPKTDLALAGASVGITITCLFVVLYFFTFVS
jgi:hypothetical protein